MGVTGLEGGIILILPRKLGHLVRKKNPRTVKVILKSFKIPFAFVVSFMKLPLRYSDLERPNAAVTTKQTQTCVIIQ